MVQIPYGFTITNFNRKKSQRLEEKNALFAQHWLPKLLYKTSSNDALGKKENTVI